VMTRAVLSIALWVKPNSSVKHSYLECLSTANMKDLGLAISMKTCTPTDTGIKSLLGFYPNILKSTLRYSLLINLRSKKGSLITTQLKAKQALQEKQWALNNHK
jgi:hypothetical protein